MASESMEETTAATDGELREGKEEQELDQSTDIKANGSLSADAVVEDRETETDKTENGSAVAVDVVENEDDNDEKQIDPFAAIPDLKDTTIPWAELSGCGKAKRVLIDWIGKALLVLFFLYVFLIALDLMGDAFTVLGGTAAGAALSESELLNNPVSALMIGILATVLLQSSSTTTSIIVSMVAADIISVEQAIPMIMGANIGTSVTNTIVAMGQVADRDEFRRAFAGATVHDCFNWLTVIVLLPLEVATGYLYILTEAIIGDDLDGGSWGGFDFSVTEPIVKYVIKIDKSVVRDIALGITEPGTGSVIQRWCDTEDVYYQGEVVREINGTNVTVVEDIYNYTIYNERCKCLFSMEWTDDLSDAVLGSILLVITLVLLIIALIGLVKVLQSILRGSIAHALMKWINADFPGYCAYFTGYVAIVIGAILTMLVQSSSVFTSTITPLVGIGFLSLKRMYPLTLGANIGTTLTSFIAAFASSDSANFIEGVQISLCHLFFNISGIILFYPIPFMRKPSIGAAKFLGNTTAKYRWFAIFYLILMFLLFPLTIFGLSLLGWQYLVGFGVPILVLVLVIIVINLMQKHCAKGLPKKMRTWEFLPAPLRSLEPYDRLFFSCKNKCKCCENHCSCCSSTEPMKDDDVDQLKSECTDSIEMVVDEHIYENIAMKEDEKV
ncbi:sodium-dependent phosphate transport protein 2B-like [Ptychodera flava]|uniref:sodium-dependent phosphate transport protein 2B-like n=1 Tax=Ptychodera flava TaxID=63121 RepID=UPI003969EB50